MTASYASDHKTYPLHPDNQLMECARPVLRLLYQLKLAKASGTPAPDKLILANALEQFLTAAARARLHHEQARQAHYLLCVAADEFHYRARRPIITTMPSLLSQFHHDSHGGEKFFDMIITLVRYPKRNGPLLALAYVLLGLGYEGMHALTPNKHKELARQRQTLYTCLKKYQHKGQKPIHPQQIKASPITQKSKNKYLGLMWCALPFLLYLAFSMALNHTFNQLQQTIGSFTAAQSHLETGQKITIIGERR